MSKTTVFHNNGKPIIAQMDVDFRNEDVIRIEITTKPKDLTEEPTQGHDEDSTSTSSDRQQDGESSAPFSSPSKFKVGDIVRIKASIYITEDLRAGQIKVITGVDNYYVRVESFLMRQEKGWPFVPAELELVQQ